MRSGMGKYSCPCLPPSSTGKRVRLPMPPIIQLAMAYWAFRSSSPNIGAMIPILYLSRDRQQVDALLKNLRLNPVELSLSRGQLSGSSQSVQKILSDVAERGDEAIVAISRQFDDPNFS